MKYSRTVLGGIAGTILLGVLLGIIVIVHIERVERAVGEAAENAITPWAQAGGETEDHLY